MSGPSGISPVDQILRNVDLAGIQDERARECIRLLLNLIESLTADLCKAQAENLYLREQLNGRKGGGGSRAFWKVPTRQTRVFAPRPQMQAVGSVRGARTPACRAHTHVGACASNAMRNPP